MKLLFIIISLFFIQNNCHNIQDVRRDFHTINSKEKLNTFIENYTNSECELTIPYVASAIMQSAKYSFWPPKKLKHFNKGKKILESFILSNPENTEARYLRILVQSEVPDFLGYNKEINTDIKFVKLKIGGSDLPKIYQNLILKNIAPIK
jgi:hypothetical protein|tara:strand:+ start:485 stop:934 length:450 start_codon:yes stop_codon:yes gene_type:complete